MRKINTPTGDWEPGDPATSTKGTLIKYWFQQMIQDELCSLVEGAGLSLDEADPETEAANNGQVLEAISVLIAQQTVQAGTVIWFATDVTPTGYLKVNGAVVDNSVYIDLDAAIYVGDANNATAEWGYRCTDPEFPSDTRSTVGQYTVLPDARAEFLRGWDDGRGVDSGRVFGSAQADELKSHSHPISAVNDSQGGTDGPGNPDDGTHVSETGYTGGTETRPRNIAFLACIKY